MLKRIGSFANITSLVIHYGLHSNQISTQLNTHGEILERCVRLHSALHHHHQSTNKGISIERIGLIAPVERHRIYVN